MDSMSLPLICYLIVLSFPFIGLLINTLFFKKAEIKGSFIATIGIWMGFIALISCWLTGIPFSEKVEHFGFMANELSWLMATLILFVSGIVHQFSLRYMAGDRQYRNFFINLNAITICTLLMVAADNVFILATFWFASNLILVLLMIHKFKWAAAKNSGILALKTFILGFTFLLVGISLLSIATGTFSLHEMTQNHEILSEVPQTIALLFIMLAAFTQSGAWPFHGWLISSLNSPTPVSALMHAGLVNGGGLLLARFAPLYLTNSFILNSLFLFGVVTLILGTIWKLMQSNIKRMLACSTMGQMGFMIMQCGLGLFPAAVAHLLFHGLFKAFLFLRVGSTLQESRRKNEELASSALTFLVSTLCGSLGAYGFAIASKTALTSANSTFILIAFAWMAGTQLAHALLEKKQTLFQFLLATLLCVTFGAIYGFSVHLIEQTLSPLSIFVPQPLNLLHIASIAFIVFIWLSMNLKPLFRLENSIYWNRSYVSMLNASQPSAKTMTSVRKEYQF